MQKRDLPGPNVPLDDPAWYRFFAGPQTDKAVTSALADLKAAIAVKQPLSDTLSAIALLVGSGFLRHEGGAWVLSQLGPADIVNPFAEYLVDDSGNYLVDELGNYLIGASGDIVPVSNGGTGSTTAAAARTALGAGIVNTIGVTTANGVSGSSSGGQDPRLTIALGAITPTTVTASGDVQATGYPMVSAGNGVVSLYVGDTTHTGYVHWRTPAGLEAAYLGYADGTAKEILFSTSNSYLLRFVSAAVFIDGDLAIKRVASPTTGAIYFGNAGGQYVFYDGANFNIVGGSLYLSGSIKTAAPAGGAHPWKLGQVKVGAVALDTANYVEVEINGVTVKLLKAT